MARAHGVRAIRLPLSATAIARTPAQDVSADDPFSPDWIAPPTRPIAIRS